jgi:signal peptidase I
LDLLPTSRLFLLATFAPKDAISSVRSGTLPKFARQPVDPYRIKTSMPDQLDMVQPSVVPIAAKTAPGRPRGLNFLSVWLRDLMISLAIAAFFVIFLYQPVKVEGTSMMPSLDDQERIFVNKFVYRIEAIQRGDIIVFRYPRDPSKSYIKRVIGVGGDRVRLADGQTYLNGKPIREDYVARSFIDDRPYREITVPQGSYFVMGDHRNVSKDSRDFGPVKSSFIYGKAVFGYWPMEKMGMLR